MLVPNGQGKTTACMVYGLMSPMRANRRGTAKTCATILSGAKPVWACFRMSGACTHGHWREHIDYFGPLQGMKGARSSRRGHKLDELSTLRGVRRQARGRLI